MAKSKTAFVMMPFASEFDDVYQSLIRDPLTAAGYEVTRADDLMNQSNILQDVVESISRATLLIADLTGNNPNVYYELGLAHALGRPVVLFAQDIADVPFDLRPYRIIPYDTHFSKMNEAIKQFTKVLGEISSKNVTFGSPITDFGISNLYQLSRGDFLADDEHLFSDMGLLDFRETLEEGMETIAKLVAEVGNRLNALNPELNKAFEQITSKPQKSVKVQRAVMQRLAQKIDSIGVCLNSANKSYNQALADIGNALNVMLSGEFPIDDEGHENLRSFVLTIDSTEAIILSAKDQFLSLSSIIDGLPRIEKEFSRANRRFSTEIIEFVGNIDQTAAIFSRAKLAGSRLLGDESN